MAEKRWTIPQRQCIEARGGSVLVSAAAGSGKTAVLVERVVGLITDEAHPVDVDQLLVVTFTNAAAAEMRQRIAAALSSRLAVQPGNRRLQRQQMRLPRAAIGTVHGFCAQLVREHFDELGLSPRFKVAEPAELRLLNQEALSEVIEEQYATDSSAFRALSDLLGGSKNDTGLFEAVYKLDEFIQAHPDPETWLRAQEDAYAREESPDTSSWGRVVLDYISGQLADAASTLTTAAKQSLSDPVLADKYAPVLQRESHSLKQLADAVKERPWDEVVALFAVGPFERLPPVRQCENTALKDQITTLRDQAKKQLKDLPSLLCGSAEECLDDVRACRPIVAALFDTVRRYATRCAEKKRAARLVDFSDLEHGALRLLMDQDGNKTPLARALSARYAEVLVDEYQDTNATQDALFAALSREENNLFLVGDVKQSIYGFRQAMPDLFLGRRAQYASYDGKTYPATITLGHNFRSRREVTDAVNFVFGQLMSSEMGGVDYDDREALTAAASYTEQAGYETELWIIDDTDRQAPDTRDAAEARVIAKRIAAAMTSLTVTEGGITRPARYGDFCVLLRNKHSHAAAYREELERLGIPSWTETGGGLLTTSEVATAAALLRLIDNPLQDVPLLAALLSPWMGFTPDDLAAIRLEDRQSGLFPAVKRYARSGSDAARRQRLAAFLQQLDGWRTLAATLPADQLLQRVYDDTAGEALVLAMPGGQRRAANLRLFLDTARRFEQKGFRGLSAFVRYIDRLEQTGLDLPTASTAGGEGAVAIYSIHHSKGLEFPFVFLAGLGSRFNRESATAGLLLHPTMGVGLKRRDVQSLTQWNTLPRQAVALQMQQSARAEELRVLYVAMTRAREKLYLVMTLDHPTRKLTSLVSIGNGRTPLPSSVLLGSSCLGDWLLMTALRHPSGGALRVLAGGGESNEVITQPTSSWHITVEAAPAAPDRIPSPPPCKPPDNALKEELESRIGYTYPYLSLQAIPTKLAASALTECQGDIRQVATARPAFMASGGLTPAQRGTALHTFMQYADYTAAAVDPAAEIGRLIAAGYLTKQEGQAIVLSRLRRFFSSSLYHRMVQADRLYRELSFTIDWPAEAYDNTQAVGETILVQGIADCVLREEGTLTIVDYKTDQIKAPAELAARYREQLRVYAFALERVLGFPVRECLLYSFSLGQTVPVAIDKNQPPP